MQPLMRPKCPPHMPATLSPCCTVAHLCFSTVHAPTSSNPPSQPPYLRRGPGDDVLYAELGDHEILLGGPGHNYLSFGYGRHAPAAALAGNTDIEAMQYDARVMFELLNRFRDAYGYVIEVNNGQDGKGDATLKTAMAATAAALAASRAAPADQGPLNDAVKSLLGTIATFSWDSSGNPVRHPTLLVYNAAGGQASISIPFVYVWGPGAGRREPSVTGGPQGAPGPVLLSVGQNVLG